LSGAGRQGHGHGHDHGHDHHFGGPEEEHQEEDETQEVVAGPPCVCCSPDPVGDLEILQHQADELIAAEEHHIAENRRETTEHAAEEVDEAGISAAEGGEEEVSGAADKEENKKLVKMGINTAIAIGIHNFPEGLATFVAALNDPRVGAVLAIAIGIHNIPEGLCVALPIYYATGNRMKAFGWALLSGASEPLAALLGWAVLANSFSDEMYAILFGLVSGMMIIISIRELLPTAHRYDPEDTVVTFSFIGGMIIMALSLVLFVL
jgi:ZIP family zinc transporter